MNITKAVTSIETKALRAEALFSAWSSTVSSKMLSSEGHPLLPYEVSNSTLHFTVLSHSECLRPLLHPSSTLSTIREKPLSGASVSDSHAKVAFSSGLSSATGTPVKPTFLPLTTSLMDSASNAVILKSYDCRHPKPHVVYR